MANLDQLQNLIDKAKHAGATDADAIATESSSLSIDWRQGNLESLERSESGSIGLRVFVGKRQAIVATTDRRSETLDELVARALAMAKAAPADEFCGIADPQDIATTWQKINLADTAEPDANALIAQAREAEEAALAVAGVTQCEGAHAGYGRSAIALVASNGFVGATSRTGYNISVSALAGEGMAMQRDSDFASCVFQADLPPPSKIGKTAGERAVSLLGARKMPTGRVPVIFDPREAAGLLGSFAGAISGASIARGTSFLKDSLDKAVFSDSITIVDDPFRPRGLRCREFDSEGLLPQKRGIIENGVLTTWLLDLRSGRQLGLRSTAHASRGASSVPSPSPSNLYIEAGSLSPKDLMRDIKSGFYVTELMGDGVNGVTGDYSRAARGFWIENGQKAFPVHEMTIASNLKDIFRQATAANDLEFRYGLNSPTLRIESMTVGGF